MSVRGRWRVVDTPGMAEAAAKVGGLLDMLATGDALWRAVTRKLKQAYSAAGR